MKKLLRLLRELVQFPWVLRRGGKSPTGRLQRTCNYGIQMQWAEQWRGCHPRQDYVSRHGG